MAKQQPPIKWTPKQKKIIELINQGLSPGEIKKELKVSYQSITKVKNALAKGEYPPEQKKVSHKPKDKQITTTDPPPPPPPPPPGNTSGEKKDELEPAPPTSLDSEIEAKLVSFPVVIPITQIMQNTKAYLVQRLHWPVETKWQDIIDTIFVHYFASCDPPVILQGWYEGNPKQVGSPPKPAGGKDKGNGHINLDSPENKQLIEAVVAKIIETLQTGNYGG